MRIKELGWSDEDRTHDLQGHNLAFLPTELHPTYIHRIADLGSGKPHIISSLLVRRVGLEPTRQYDTGS